MWRIWPWLTRTSRVALPPTSPVVTCNGSDRFTNPPDKFAVGVHADSEGNVESLASQQHHLGAQRYRRVAAAQAKPSARSLAAAGLAAAEWPAPKAARPGPSGAAQASGRARGVLRSAPCRASPTFAAEMRAVLRYRSSVQAPRSTSWAVAWDWPLCRALAQWTRRPCWTPYCSPLSGRSALWRSLTLRAARS